MRNSGRDLSHSKAPWSAGQFASASNDLEALHGRKNAHSSSILPLTHISENKPRKRGELTITGSNMMEKVILSMR